MKRRTYAGCLALVCLCTGFVQAGESAGSADAEQAIRQLAVDFTEAFNRGDAQAVAGHWTEDGVYVNENGQRYEGREAIQKEYTDFFAANQGVKMHLMVDSVRLVEKDKAIEEGRATIGPSPLGLLAYSWYEAVHVNRDGKWLMLEVRDSRVDLPSHYDRLSDLDFLVGTWSAENEGAQIQVTCRWIVGWNFIERTQTVREGDSDVSSSKQIIGWDPITQQITSWMFTSDGGHAVGTWTPHDTGWTIETTGVMMDGTITSAVNSLSRADDNAVAWQSTRRMKGDVSLPDMAPVVLKRVSDAESANTIQPSSAVVTVVEGAVLKRGSQAIDRLPKDAELSVLEIRGKWVGVRAEVNGQARKGWVLRHQVKPR